MNERELVLQELVVLGGLSKLRQQIFFKTNPITVA